MKYVEYGKGNKDIIILMHGGGLSWWNYETAAASLENEYHVILPMLDGHAGSDKGFTTIEDNAAEIVEFIDERLGGRVLMIGGLSLGAQILLEILSLRPDICSHAIVESPLVIPSKATYAMIEPAFGSCYGLIRQRWFSRLQFKSLRIRGELFDHYYRDTVAISKSDMIAFMKANSVYSMKQNIKNCTAKTIVVVGSKEYGFMKKSAKIVNNTLQNSTLEVARGLYHGEFSINHGEEYAALIRDLIKT